MAKSEGIPTYLACASVTAMVRVGGMSKSELLEELRRQGIKLNEAGEALFADDRFATSEGIRVMKTVQTSVIGLGCAQGATFAEIQVKAGEVGLALCPLELAPHLRLQLLHQPEGNLSQLSSEHRAPPGSITVASRPLTEDHSVPKGFYLRRINGVLWLRGYRSGPEHVWSPQDVFVFCLLNNVT